jgi:hypothetical protein
MTLFCLARNSPLSGQVIQVSELRATLAPLHRATLENEPQMLSRALLFLHEWGECVYFDKDGLRDLMCLSTEYLSQSTMAKLFQQDFLLERKGSVAGVFRNSEFGLVWRGRVDVPAHVVPLILLFLRHLKLSFPYQTHDPATGVELPFEDQSTVIPSLLPSRSKLDVPLVWPASSVAHLSCEKQVFLFFDLLPVELVNLLIVSVQQLLAGYRTLLFWKKGVIFGSDRCLAKVEEEEVLIRNHLSKDKVQNSTVVTIKIRSAEHTEGFNAMQIILSALRALLKGYPGITSKLASSPCPFHPNHCFVQLSNQDHDVKCLSSDQSVHESDVLDAQVRAGLKLPEGLCLL